MTNAKLILIGFSAAVILSGCASTLPPPDNMRLTSKIAAPEKCQYLGDVRGDQNLYGGTQFNQLARDSAESAIMQDAAKLGANTVLVQQSTSGFMGANMRGQAYRCAE